MSSLLDSVRELLESPEANLALICQLLQSRRERPRPRPWSRLHLVIEEEPGILELFPQVTKALLPLLASENSSRRHEALLALSLAPCGEAAEALLLGLNDPMSVCRVRAVDGLALCSPTSRAITGVIALLKDPKAPVRLHAAAALGQMGATEAIQPLRDLLEQEEETAGVKEWAAFALAELGEQVEAELISSDPLAEAEEDESIQREAAQRVADGLAALLGSLRGRDKVTMGDFASGLDAMEKQFAEEQANQEENPSAMTDKGN